MYVYMCICIYSPCHCGYAPSDGICANLDVLWSSEKINITSSSDSPDTDKPAGQGDAYVYKALKKAPDNGWVGFFIDVQFKQKTTTGIESVCVCVCVCVCVMYVLFLNQEVCMAYIHIILSLSLSLSLLSSISHHIHS